MIFAAFILVAQLQLLFWGLWFRHAYRDEWRTPPPDAAGPASVIVCFRNEADTLRSCIEGILQQEYPPGFELILVDDNSTDRSTTIALAFAHKDDRIRVLYPGQTRPGKKDALAYGIAQASYDRLVLTDADCVPASNDWLYLMAGRLNGPHELVLGVSPYRTAPQAPFLHRWQWFESVYVSLKYLGFARRGLPYMGVGRNLAYTKAFYLRAGGFHGHADLPGGDDDLLVSGAAHATGTTVATEPAAWTFSRPQPSWPAYFRQRARHQSTGVRYPGVIAACLTLIALTQGFFYLLAGYLLWHGYAGEVIAVYTLRLCLQLQAYLPAFRVTTGRQYLDTADVVTHVARVACLDFLLGPMYAYLAGTGIVPQKEWG